MEFDEKLNKRFTNKVVPAINQMGSQTDRPEAKATMRQYLKQEGMWSVLFALGYIPVAFFVAFVLGAVFTSFVVGAIGGLAVFYFIGLKIKRAIDIFITKSEPKYYEKRLDMIREGKLGTDGQPIS